jgi:hypothetical protein
MVLISRAERYSGTWMVKLRTVVLFAVTSAWRSIEMRCLMGGPIV